MRSARSSFDSRVGASYPGSRRLHPSWAPRRYPYLLRVENFQLRSVDVSGLSPPSTTVLPIFTE